MVAPKKYLFFLTLSRRFRPFKMSCEIFLLHHHHHHQEKNGRKKIISKFFPLLSVSLNHNWKCNQHLCNIEVNKIGWDHYCQILSQVTKLLGEITKERKEFVLSISNFTLCDLSIKKSF